MPRSSLSRKHDIGNVLTSNVSLCFVSEFKKLDPLAAEDAAVILSASTSSDLPGTCCGDFGRGSFADPRPARSVEGISFSMSSARDTPLSEIAVGSSGSVASAFRLLFLPLCSTLATAGCLRSVAGSASTAASTSTMGAGGNGYRELDRNGTTTTTTAGAMARRSTEPRCREGCWSRLHTRRRR